MNRSTQLDDIDLKALELYREDLKKIEKERASVLLTIQVIDILRNEKLVYESETVSSLRLSIVQEIDRASIRWKKHLETAKLYLSWMHKRDLITGRNSIPTLLSVLKERLAEVTL